MTAPTRIEPATLRQPGRSGGALPVIGDPAIQQVADRIVRMVQMAGEKALAHEADPARFPLPADPDSLEQVIRRHASRRPAAKRQEAVARAVQSTARLSSQFRGDLDRISLASAEPVEQQFMRIEPPDALKIGVAQIKRVAFVNNHIVTEREPATLFALKNGVVVRVAPAKSIIGIDLGTLIATPIQQKWTQLGGESGFLGKATTPETKTPDGVGRFRHFEGGSIYWTRQTGAHEVHGAIREKWKQLGWETSFLGYPTTDESTPPDGRGRFSHFQGGSIYWTPETGAREVHGAIREKWAALGWETGYLGYPVTDETATPDTVGRFNHFQGGSIYWHPHTGAWAVHARVRDAWAGQGWELGSLGYPLTDTAGVGSATLSNVFQGGRVDWREQGGPQVGRPVTKLHFRLHSVRCVEETSGFGSDEIDFGGVATDAALNSAVMGRFRVSSDFDDGETVTFNPPRIVHTFDLMNPAWWPKSLLVTFMLAEIDSGGFNDTLVELLKKIRGIVEKELTKLAVATVGGAIGAGVGSAIPFIGTVVGMVIGAVVGYIVGAVFDWLIGMFNDDDFAPAAIPVVVPSVHHRWAGAMDTPEWFVSMRGHGGHYEVRGDWALAP